MSVRAFVALLFASVALAHPAADAEHGTPVEKRSPSISIIPIHYTPIPIHDWCGIPTCTCNYAICPSANGVLSCCNPATDSCISSGPSQGACCPTNMIGTMNTGEQACCAITPCGSGGSCTGNLMCVQGCCEKPPP